MHKTGGIDTTGFIGAEEIGGMGEGIQGTGDIIDTTGGF